MMENIDEIVAVPGLAQTRAIGHAAIPHCRFLSFIGDFLYKK
jgi:hypothetical protein